MGCPLRGLTLQLIVTAFFSAVKVVGDYFNRYLPLLA